MKEFTFEIKASVTVHAETEQKARLLLVDSYEEEDVHYGHVGVYLPPENLAAALLVDVYEEED